MSFKKNSVTTLIMSSDSMDLTIEIIATKVEAIH